MRSTTHPAEPDAGRHGGRPAPARRPDGRLAAAVGAVVVGIARRASMAAILALGLLPLALLLWILVVLTVVLPLLARPASAG